LLKELAGQFGMALIVEFEQGRKQSTLIINR